MMIDNEEGNDDDVDSIDYFVVFDGELSQEIGLNSTEIKKTNTIQIETKTA